MAPLTDSDISGAEIDLDTDLPAEAADSDPPRAVKSADSVRDSKEVLNSSALLRTSLDSLSSARAASRLAMSGGQPHDRHSAGDHGSDEDDDLSSPAKRRPKSGRSGGGSGGGSGGSGGGSGGSTGH